MNSKLYVGNLSFTTSEADLRDAFAPFGTLSEVYLATDRDTGSPRGFAFLTYSTPQECQLAVQKMHGVELGGRPLTVNEAKPREPAAGGRNFGPNLKPFRARNRY